MSRRALRIACVIWTAFGIAPLLVWLRVPLFGLEMVLLIPMMVGALPFVVATELGGITMLRGTLWGSVHGPGFLTPIGLAVVYIIPGLGGLYWLWRTRPRAPEPVSQSQPD